MKLKKKLGIPTWSEVWEKNYRYLPCFRCQTTHSQSSWQDVALLQDGRQVINTLSPSEATRHNGLSKVMEAPGVVTGVAVATWHGLATVGVEVDLSKV